MKNVQNFLRISKEIVFFLQTRNGLTHALLNILKNMLK